MYYTLHYISQDAQIMEHNGKNVQQVLGKTETYTELQFEKQKEKDHLEETDTDEG